MPARPTPQDLETLDAAAIEARLPALDASALELLIRRANREYWDENAATLPDPLYDRLVEALRALDPGAAVLAELGQLAPEGPAIEAVATHDIPPEARLGKPVRHRRPMLSLDKCYTPADLMSWAAKFEGDVLVMPKLDGIAVSLRYDARGALYLAATRGSGVTGEDITVNALEIEAIPRRLEPAAAGGGELEIRGEVFMRLSVFARFADRYANPRNLTAGAVKHKERGRTRDYALSFYPYDIEGPSLADEREKLALLARLGFESDAAEVVAREGLAAAFEGYAARRAELDYEIDGVVYRAATVAEQERLGSTGHHPRWSIAYKFQGDTGETRVRDVAWSVSRTGTVTPVALLEPIELSGVMVGRASLHNINRFEELGLSVGALVEVTRRGGVIPNVERLVEPGPGGQLFVPPSQCPACNGPVERRKKRDGEFLFCVQPENCIQARLGELEHFAKVVDMQGFGPKVIQQAVEKGLLSSPADYYRLGLDDLVELDRLGRRSAQNLVDQIAAHRDLDLATFLYALGIEHLGRHNGSLLASEFGTLGRVRAVTRDELMAVRGIKEAIADALVKGLAERSELIDALLENVSVQEASRDAAPADEASDAGPLAGRSFLFTGALEAVTRKAAQARVVALGGIAAEAVTKDLSVLVLGAGKGAKSSKQKKAEALIASGAPLTIMTEAEFLTLVEGAGQRAG